MMTNTDNGLSFDRILFYASDRCGLADYTVTGSTRRRVAALEAEGKIVMRERVAEIPGEARTITIRTWHAV